MYLLFYGGKQMKVLIACGSTNLEKYLKTYATDHQFESVASRRYIIDRNKEHQYQVIILSGMLPGRENLREIIFKTQRESNCRIIFLVGESKPVEVLEAFLFGVRDFIFDPVDPKQLLEVIDNPSTYGDAAGSLKIIPNQSESLFKLVTESYLKQVFELVKKHTPDPPPEVTTEAKEILNGMLALLRQDKGETIEESLLNLEAGLSNLLTEHL